MIDYRKLKGIFATMLAVLFILAVSAPVQAKIAKPAVQAIPKVQFVKAPITEYTEGDRVQFDIYAPNYSGKVEYRVVLWNDSNKSYGDLWDSSNGHPARYYTKWQPGGKSVFTLGWPINEPGTYRITVYVKRVGVPASKAALKGMNCDSFVESVAFTVKPKVAVESGLTLDKVGTTYSPADGKTPAKVSGDVKIAANNITFENSDVEGNIYISADNATLNNVNVNGTITVDPGKDGTTNLKNVKATNIKVLSGGENSIHLESVDAQNLLVSSDSNVRVESTGTTKIGNTEVTSYAILDSKGGTLGTIVVSKSEGNTFEVELRGTFTEPVVVKTDVTIKTDKDASVAKLEIAPTEKNANIKLEGKFEKVEVNNEAKIELAANTSVNTFVANANTTVQADKTAKVEKVEKTTSEVKTEGEGAANIGNSGDTGNAGNTGNSGGTGNTGGGGGYYPPANIYVSRIQLNLQSCAMKVGDTVNLTGTVYPSNATNKSITWISSDETVVKVENGKLVAFKAGKVVITAKSADGNNVQSIANITVSQNDLKAKVEAKQEGSVKITLNNNITKNDEVTLSLLNESGEIKYINQVSLDNGQFTIDTKLDRGSYKLYIKGLYTEKVELLLSF